MKKLLGCQIFMVCMGASLAWATPRISPMNVSSLDQAQAVSARLSLTLDQENYECKGQIKLLEPSVLPCGDRRQGMIEFQGFNHLENAVIAVYQPGKQQGFLYLARRQGETFAASTDLVILTPGYGSLGLFTKYILDPMKGKMTEAQVFEVLPQMFSLPQEVNISTLRDRIANREYEAFLPKEEPKDPPQEEVKPEVKTEEKKAESLPEKKPDMKKSEPTSPVVHETPRNVERKKKKPRRKTTKVHVYRGTDLEIVEVPAYDSEDQGFAPPSPRRRVVKNPHGYNLRELSAEEIRELERAGLISFGEN